MENTNLTTEILTTQDIYNDMVENIENYSQIEILALMDEYRNNDKRSEYVYMFDSWVNTGLENWFIELSDEELKKYEVTSSEIECVLQNEYGVKSELTDLVNRQIEKLLKSALKNEINRRNKSVIEVQRNG